MSIDPSATTCRSPAPAAVDDPAHYLPRTVCATTPAPAAAGWPRVKGYELLAVVGTGGMGVVYRARHRELQRTVAIKTLRGAALSDPEYRERFRAEAEAVARLQHPNIIQVFEVGTADPWPGETEPCPYIALEFVDGGDLTALAETPQPPRTAAFVVEKLARAAHAAHRLGVIHRDLKPANVLLTADGEPKIADFGVAKQIGGGGLPGDQFVTMTGIVVGTPEYMAPEQAFGESPTPAVDTYALGVILYELLTGRVPFHGTDGGATMMLARTQEPVPPRRLQPGVPTDLDTICLKCLEKGPGRRYLTAEALADDLARWTDGRPILARPVGPAERVSRWAARNPTIAALWATVVVVTLAGMAGVVWNWQEARANAAEARDHAEAERWERYRADLVAASNAHRLHDTDGGRRALDAAPPEHRNWEWAYLRGKLDLADQTLTVIDRRGDNIRMTPGGRRVAFGIANTVRVWDVGEDRLVGTVPGKAAQERYTLDPAGTLAAYAPFGPEGATVVLWDVAAGRQRAALRGHRAEVHHVAFFPDGRRVATQSTDGELRVWDTADGTAVSAAAGLRPTVGPLRFADGGRLLFIPCGSCGVVQVYDLAAGRLLHTLHLPGDFVGTVNPTPDGKLAAVRLAGDRHELLLWRVGEPAPYATLKGHVNTVVQYEYSPDLTRLVTASYDQTARLWEVATGRQLAVLRGHTGWVPMAAFSPDGGRVVTASHDHTVRLWDGHTGEPVTVLHGHTDEVDAAAFTPDGRDVVSAARDGAVKRWDVGRAERAGILRGHTNFVYAVAVHPDGRRVASAGWDGTVRVWDADAGRELFAVEHADRQIVSSVAYHPAGRLLASLGRDGAVRLWDADTGRPLGHLPAKTHDWMDGRIAFDPAGDRLAVAHEGGVTVWDVAGRTPLAELTAPGDVTARGVAFSPDGRHLAVVAYNDDDFAVRLWDVARGELATTLPGHTDRPYTVAFHPAGDRLASGAIDGTVRLWDVAGKREPVVMRQGCNVYALAFTPDGSRLASAGADGGIRLWDVRTGQLVADLRGHKDYVHGIAFSDDGRRLASGSGDFTVRVWDAGPP